MILKRRQTAKSIDDDSIDRFARQYLTLNTSNLLSGCANNIDYECNYTTGCPMSNHNNLNSENFNNLSKKGIHYYSLELETNHSKCQILSSIITLGIVIMATAIFLNYYYTINESFFYKISDMNWLAIHFTVENVLILEKGIQIVSLTIGICLLVFYIALFILIEMFCK